MLRPKRNKEWSRALDATLITLLIERYPSGRLNNSDTSSIQWEAIYNCGGFQSPLNVEKLQQRLNDTYSVWLAQAVRSFYRLLTKFSKLP